MERRTLIIAFVLTLICFGILYAYVLKKANWNWVESTPKVVQIWINPNCADPSAPNELSAITNAYNTWSDAATNFDFDYGGTSSVTYFTPENNHNDMCWNSGSNPEYPLALATTKVWVYVGCEECLAQADVVFWDGPWDWSTSSTPGSWQIDVQSIALHELGHVLGLGDQRTIPSGIMYHRFDPGDTKRNLATDDINGIRTIYGLVVSIPNGSNTWDVGQLYYILWNSGGVSGNVNILLNREHPDPYWGYIIQNTPNDGTESWTATNPPTSDCRIRVESVNNLFVYDVSDADFTVAGYKVTYPTASGIHWFIGTYRTIRWTSVGVTGNVNIELNRDYPNPNAWSTQVYNTPNDGSYTWHVGGDPSTTCRIKVRHSTNANNYAISKNNFEIASFED